MNCVLCPFTLLVILLYRLFRWVKHKRIKPCPKCGETDLLMHFDACGECGEEWEVD